MRGCVATGLVGPSFTRFRRLWLRSRPVSWLESQRWTRVARHGSSCTAGRRADPADKHLEHLPTCMAVVLVHWQASDLPSGRRTSGWLSRQPFLARGAGGSPPASPPDRQEYSRLCMKAQYSCRAEYPAGYPLGGRGGREPRTESREGKTEGQRSRGARETRGAGDTERGKRRIGETGGRRLEVRGRENPAEGTLRP